MNNKELLYKKLNALRLEVDSSIVDDIVSTVDDLFSQQNGAKPIVSGSLPLADLETKVEGFIQQHRKICWEAEFEQGEFCVGENRLRDFVRRLKRQ